jgi:hypothetical protein
VPRKHRFDETVQDGFQRFSRWRPTDRTVLPDIVKDVARRPQLSDDAIETPPRLRIDTLIVH